MERVILHSDLNNFFASVEAAKNPTLQGKVFAVAGDPNKRHGIILAKNQAAKKMGVSTGEAIWQAKQKCPDLVLVPPDMASYRTYSEKVQAIYRQYTDIIVPFGIDECWLDVTGSLKLFGCGPKIAYEIRNKIKQELGLTVSIGVSFNKFFAKLGSDLNKPDATTVISKENYQQVVYPLPVSALLFVGTSTCEKLAHYGIHTVGQLAATDPAFLVRIFGKIGLDLYRRATGYETDEAFGAIAPEKSISNSVTTTQDLCTPEEIKVQMMMIAEHVASRLRDRRLAGSLISIFVRDNRLKSITRQRSLEICTNNSSEIADAALDLFWENYDLKIPVRAIGIGVGKLQPDDGNLQLTLFDPTQKRLRHHNLDEAVDQLRDRFGFDCLTRAGCLHRHIKNYTLYDPENPTPFCTLPTCHI
ncbi:MAG: DNA polymerase IV [Clostridia bacterium]|nr:DNA polymerase IV [Clostridia bacterium]